MTCRLIRGQYFTNPAGHAHGFKATHLRLTGPQQRHPGPTILGSIPFHLSPAILLKALVRLVQVLHGGAVADTDDAPYFAVRVQLLEQAGLRGHLLLRRCSQL